MNSKLEYRNEVFEAMSKEMDGFVYAHLWISCFMGKNYSLSTDYYTVKSGKVYLIRHDKLYESGDTLLDVNTSCTKLENLTPENLHLYISSHKDVSFNRLQKFFKPTQKDIDKQSDF